ncbi:MAG: alpha/beta hydrolase [Myxococcota bacterium]
MARELTLDIPGLELAAVAYGPEDGRRVLALHGWLDNAASFAPLAPLLDDCHVVCLDLAGHGRSQHRAAHAGYHFIDWIPDVIAAADALGWERFTLMGHSMGAAIASLTAGTYPDWVDRLILIDGLAPMSTEPHDVPGTLRRFIDQQRRLTFKTPKPYPNAEVMVDRLNRVVDDLTPETAALIVSRALTQVEGGVTWSYDNRLRRTSSMRFSQAHVDAFLSAVQAPTLFVRPRDGIPIPPELIDRAVQLLGDVQVFKMDGKHHAHMDSPGEVAEAIRRFLEMNSIAKEKR